MITSHQSSMTSAELGTLWIVYQKKTLMVQMMKYFISKAEDLKAKEILEDFLEKERELVNEIKMTFQREGAVIPVGFTEKDVNIEAPALFESMYDIMFLRMMNKVAMGIHSLHLTMNYREDLIQLHRKISVNAQHFYDITTQFLLEKGVLAKPPTVSMPKKVEFIQDKEYMKGFRIFKKRRVLNTIEVAYLYQGIESNLTGLNLMAAFGQVSSTRDVQEFFLEGVKISKKIISVMNNLLLESDIQAPATGVGRPTRSTVPPFSEKLMMFITELLTNFSLGNNAIGSTFGLRGDLQLKLALISQDVFELSQKGMKIMVKYKWMEEPPQMENRESLIKRKYENT